MPEPTSPKPTGNFGGQIAEALIATVNGRLPAGHRPTAAHTTEDMPTELKKAADWSKISGVTINAFSISGLELSAKYILIGTTNGNTYCITRTASGGELACFNNRTGSGHIVNQEDREPGRIIEVGKPGNFAGFTTSPITSIRYTNRL